jgi:hypothetical protein
MWVIDLLVNLPSPYSRAPTRPSTPEMLGAKECTSTPSPSTAFIFGLAIESIKELGGCIIFSWSMNNHNLVTNLHITLIFIHEFFNYKNIGLELFNLVYKWLKLCEGTYNGYKRYFSFLLLVLISIGVVTMIVLIFYCYVKGL